MKQKRQDKIDTNTERSTEKIINYYMQEEVKANEISDKRGEWQNETKKKLEKEKMRSRNKRWTKGRWRKKGNL